MLTEIDCVGNTCWSTLFCKNKFKLSRFLTLTSLLHQRSRMVWMYVRRFSNFKNQNVGDETISRCDDGSFNVVWKIRFRIHEKFKNGYILNQKIFSHLDVVFDGCIQEKSWDIRGTRTYTKTYMKIQPDPSKFPFLFVKLVTSFSIEIPLRLVYRKVRIQNVEIYF